MADPQSRESIHELAKEGRKIARREDSSRHFGGPE
jgi:hypothetical protein